MMYSSDSARLSGRLPYASNNPSAILEETVNQEVCRRLGDWPRFPDDVFGDTSDLGEPCHRPIALLQR
jgi:hypothetical protein